MNKLQQWMTKTANSDDAVARAVKRHRSQISRIRRGESTASLITAKRLEKLTGISWHHFFDLG